MLPHDSAVSSGGVPMEGSSDGAGVSPAPLSGRRVALLASGNYNPPTYAHLRMFERARDYVERTQGGEVVAGIMSPHPDVSALADMASTRHRMRMVELSLKKNKWIRLGTWESDQTNSTSPLLAIKHYQEEITTEFGADVQVIMLCGGDELDSLATYSNTPSSEWTIDDLSELVEHHTLIVIERPVTDPSRTVYLDDILRKNQRNIHIICDETFPNNISSTRIRTALRRGESVRYSLPDKVLHYIHHYGLYSTMSIPRCPPSRASEGGSSSASTPLPLPPSSPFHSRPYDLHQSASARLSQSTHPAKPSSSGSVWETTSLERSPRPPRSPRVDKKDLERLEKMEKLENLVDSLIEEENFKFEAKQGRGTADQKEHSESPSKTSTKGMLQAGPAMHLSKYCPPSTSPDYDNVTLDELLHASNSWAAYMNEQYRQLKSRPDPRPQDDEDEPTSSGCTGRKKKDKDPNLPKSPTRSRIPFFRKISKTNVYERKEDIPKPEKKVCNCAILYHEDFYGVQEMPGNSQCECSMWLGRDEQGRDTIRKLSHTGDSRGSCQDVLDDRLPDMKRTGRKASKERRKESLEFPPSHHNGEDRISAERKASKSIRFANTMARSMESIPQTNVCPSSPAAQRGPHAQQTVNGRQLPGIKMSQSVYDPVNNTSDDKVTLSFTRYRLSATPETTV